MQSIKLANNKLKFSQILSSISQSIRTVKHNQLLISNKSVVHKKQLIEYKNNQL